MSRRSGRRARRRPGPPRPNRRSPRPRRTRGARRRGRPSGPARPRRRAAALARGRCRCWRPSRRTPCRAVRDPWRRIFARPTAPRGMLAPMRSHTAYLTFETAERREFVRITDDVQEAVAASGVAEGMVLVSAMHITAGVWVNDDEPGILEDTLEWLDKLAPPSWKEPANDVARALGPHPGDFPPHPGGGGNGDAHWKNLLVHHQVVLPITDGRLDLGPWQAVFYAEFDGRRAKRLVIKVRGE